MRVVKPSRGLGTGNDRSEPRARDLAQVLEHSGEAVIVKDLNALVTYWNREAASLYGFPRRRPPVNLCASCMLPASPRPNTHVCSSAFARDVRPHQPPRGARRTVKSSASHLIRRRCWTNKG